jgi:Uma2 family endonuclease
MTAVPVDFPSGSRPFTVEDLERMPDDGRRYELLDGGLHVSPAPGAPHQKVVGQLVADLIAACPKNMVVFPAPFAVRPSRDTELQPDVLVTRYEDLTPTMKDLLVAPLLVVEVLSPSTALLDINIKKTMYQRMDVPDYWIVDPLEARLTVFELDEAGDYVQIAEVKGEDVFEAERPFPVRVVPADLLGPLWRML